MHRTEGTNFIIEDSKNKFTDGPPGTTVTAAWLNAVQEELCGVIEQAGIVLKSAGTDQQGQLITAMQTLLTTFDFTISSQPTFNDAIERVAANQYKFKDAYSGIYIKSITGGYQMSGVNSPLSGGDSWGYLQTNQSNFLLCEGGVEINFGDTAGYLEINTDDAVLENIHIKGLGVASAAISRSFLLNAYRVNFKNCKTSDRQSTAEFAGFEESSTSAHNETSRYIGCSVFDITTTGVVDLYGFKGYCNTDGHCKVYDNTSGGDIYKGHSNSSEYEIVTEDITLQANKKYLVDGIGKDLTLPDIDNVGDNIEIFSKGMNSILQGSADNGISYLDKYFTTKGATGYLRLSQKNRAKLTYQGDGKSRIEPGAKLSDPASLPTNTGNTSSFSYDGIYLAVAHVTSPFITIYKNVEDITKTWLVTELNTLYDQDKEYMFN